MSVAHTVSKASVFSSWGTRPNLAAGGPVVTFVGLGQSELERDDVRAFIGRLPIRDLLDTPIASLKGVAALFKIPAALTSAMTDPAGLSGIWLDEVRKRDAKLDILSTERQQFIAGPAIARLRASRRRCGR